MGHVEAAAAAQPRMRSVGDNNDGNKITIAITLDRKIPLQIQ